VETDAALEKTLQTLHDTYVAPTKDIKVLTLDVVTTLYEETNISKIPVITPKLYGFALVDEHGTSGVILP
jgi:hypothetical protein